MIQKDFIEDKKLLQIGDHQIINMMLLKTNNYYKLSKSQQKDMESKEGKICNN